jgi:glycosyltransferase involved in cell wall biosynthesis
MSTSAPDVALVIETENEGEGHGIRLANVLEAWKRQTCATRIQEIISVSPRGAVLEQLQSTGIPVRCIDRPNARYYEQKNAGALAARAPYIAFADADAQPDSDWLERGLARLTAAPPEIAGVTGHTHFPPRAFAREIALAQWPHLGQEPGETNAILAHNLLMRAEPMRRAFFGAPHVRHGGDTLLVEALHAAGYRVVYEPTMRVTHNYANRLGELWMHCVALGWNYATMERHRGAPRVGALRNTIGRYRTLARRLFASGRQFEIRTARYPLSLAFFVWYCVAIGRGYDQAMHGEPEPFGSF